MELPFVTFNVGEVQLTDRGGLAVCTDPRV